MVIKTAWMLIFHSTSKMRSTTIETNFATKNISDINEHKYTYEMGTLYMDIITECEKLGDYVVNVVEARLGLRQK